HDKTGGFSATQAPSPPTCHNNPRPGFVKNPSAIKAKGIDPVAFTGVNDVFVMDAWKKASGGDGIEFLADGSAAWAKAIGITADLTERGLGVRSGRYSMVVEDGVVKSLNIEEAPGKAAVAAGDNLLQSLGVLRTTKVRSPRSDQTERGLLCCRCHVLSRRHPEVRARSASLEG